MRRDTVLGGFTEECVVHDFPIRDRKAILHVRRRRWTTPDGHNDVLDYGELLGAWAAQDCPASSRLFKKYVLDNTPVTVKSVADTYRLNASSLGKASRNV